MSKQRRSIRLLIVSFAVAVCAKEASAATYTCGNSGVANSCTPSSLQSLINSARDGDTVNIAAGTHNWTAGVPVVISKRITVSGGGHYAVDANHNDAGTWPATLTTGTSVAFVMNVTTTGSGFPRLTGISMSGSPNFTYAFNDNDAGGLFVRANSTNIASYRIDNNKFHSSSPHCGVYGNSAGLIDHNYFWADQIEGHCIYLQDWGPSGNGDEAWVRPVGFGGPDFTFIEDNTMVRPGGFVNFENSAVDAQLGAKYVFRHNYVRNGSLSMHGNSGGSWTRPPVATEVYQNTFVFESSVSWQTTMYQRAGTMLYYNNNITGYFQAWVKLWSERAAGCPNGCGNWTVCDGTHPWDGNKGGGIAGYPCLDQVGRGQTPSGIPGGGASCNYCSARNLQPQQASPTRVWGNTGTYTGGCGGTSQHGGAICNNNPTTIVDGADYVFSMDASAALPGYTPYTYPHPFQAGTSGPPPPAPPSNVRIK